MDLNVFLQAARVGECFITFLALLRFLPSVTPNVILQGGGTYGVTGWIGQWHLCLYCPPLKRSCDVVSLWHGVPSPTRTEAAGILWNGHLRAAPLQHCNQQCCMSTISMIGMSLESMKSTVSYKLTWFHQTFIPAYDAMVTRGCAQHSVKLSKESYVST